MTTSVVGDMSKTVAFCHFKTYFQFFDKIIFCPCLFLFFPQDTKFSQSYLPDRLLKVLDMTESGNNPSAMDLGKVFYKKSFYIKKAS